MREGRATIRESVDRGEKRPYKEPHQQLFFSSSSLLTYSAAQSPPDAVDPNVTTRQRLKSTLTDVEALPFSGRITPRLMILLLLVPPRVHLVLLSSISLRSPAGWNVREGMGGRKERWTNER